jgi:UPF0271 protein
MKAVDLNSDMGESDKEIDRDYCILDYVTSANVACGFHAGDPYTMLRIVKRCVSKEKGIGAHPSFFDRENFGRSRIEMPKDMLIPAILYQIGALEGICKAEKGEVYHLKPHGALYNMSAEAEVYANAVVEAAKISGKAILTLPGSKVMKIAQRENVKVFSEGFADRGYTSKGTLAPRGSEGALITEPDMAAERALKLVDGSPLKTVDGGSISLEVQSICIHSDTPNACGIAKAVRERLEEAGITVLKLSEL